MIKYVIKTALLYRTSIRRNVRLSNTNPKTTVTGEIHRSYLRKKSFNLSSIVLLYTESMNRKIPPIKPKATFRWLLALYSNFYLRSLAFTAFPTCFARPIRIIRKIAGIIVASVFLVFVIFFHIVTPVLLVVFLIHIFVGLKRK
jgi:hypothetical protein